MSRISASIYYTVMDDRGEKRENATVFLAGKDGNHTNIGTITTNILKFELST